VAALGTRLAAQLPMFARHRPYIGEVRGIGLLWAFELCQPGGKDPIPPVTMNRLAGTLRRHHLHMHKRDNLVYFAPPFVITAAELDEAMAALGRAFDEALA
jgi:adenosylmethionine-8-amino-7-oxononanoate aminotransferase